MAVNVLIYELIFAAKYAKKKLKPLTQRRLERTGRRLRFSARHAQLYLTLSHIPSPTVVINLNYKNPLNLM